MLYDLLYFGEDFKACQGMQIEFATRGFTATIDHDEIYGSRLVIEHPSMKDEDWFRILLEERIALSSIGFRMFWHENKTKCLKLIEEVKQK